MQFFRLRIAGFKSFAEPTEFRIEPGLTGVVGPNGCGKSNLLEALRWVMGAGSARAMRAGAMDDVIFAGAAGRPSREHAEVTLTVDNADRTAPAAFNDHDVLEVSRRIDRGEGSTYRVNGTEARARDVQLLFADASTGANSPSLVRQGQISELIAAKPANRRRILEEAAGVSGLHARRHEAELRLAAAEANGERLDAVIAEAEIALARLGRESRRAETYKRIAADIRVVKAAAMHARWAQAQAATDEAAQALADAGRDADEAEREAARRAVASQGAAERIPVLRDAEMTAAAVLQHAAVNRDLLDREVSDAAAELARAEAASARADADGAREAAAVQDAEGAVRRLQGEIAEVERLIAVAPARLPQLEASLAAASEARAEADSSLERQSAERAAAEAIRTAALAALVEMEDFSRAEAERALQAGARRDRLAASAEAARADLAALAGQADAVAAQAERASLSRAEAALADAHARRDAAEAQAAEATRVEARARDAHHDVDDALRRLKSEAEGLVQLAAAARRGPHAPALDAVRPKPGWEAAVAAAFGDDLDAALDPAAPAHWSGADPPSPSWPPGAEPLAPHVEAPAALAARLALTATASRAEGDRLVRALPCGARLVSREGDLWRWDGLVVRAGSPGPAAIRLAQRNRLLAIEAQAAELAPDLARLGAELARAGARVRTTSDARRMIAAGPSTAERAVVAARALVDRRATETARRRRPVRGPAGDLRPLDERPC